MTVYQMIGYLVKYDVVTLILGIAVCLVTAIIKKQLPTKDKKIQTLLPFAPGIAFYGVYALFFRKICVEDAIRQGLAVGTCATVVYVFYKEFIHGKDPKTKRVTVVALLISRYVDKKSLSKATEQVLTAFTKENSETGQAVHEIALAIQGYTSLQAEERLTLANRIYWLLKAEDQASLGENCPSAISQSENSAGLLEDGINGDVQAESSTDGGSQGEN